MALLNTADKIYIGGNLVSKAYLGANLVWQPPVIGGGPTTSLLNGVYSPGTDRNDFDGQVGVRLGIGGTDIPFIWMGMRKHNAGQTGNHTIKLYEWFSDTLVCSGVVDLTGKAVGSFTWVAVPSFTLLANGYYALLMDTFAYDGQTWCNPGPPVSIAGMSNVYGCYRPGSGGMGTTGQNEMFNGLDLGWGIAPTYDAASSAIFAAFTIPPTSARKTLIDNCVKALKTAGVWAKLDCMYLFAAADRQAAGINWIAPGTFTAVDVNGALPFTVDRGIAGMAGRWVSTTFNPTTASGAKFKQNDASMFAWGLDNLLSGGIFGNGQSVLRVYPRYTDGLQYMGLNAGVSSVATSDARGLTAGSRLTANSAVMYKNGVNVKNVADTTSAIANLPLVFLSGSSDQYAGSCAGGGFGSQLTAADHLAIYNAFNTYMAGTAPTYQAESNAIFNAFTVPPTTARKALIDNCVIALKTAGVWAKLDALYLPAAADSQAAKINWINPGTYNCTEIGSPVTFTVDRGFTGASGKWLNTGFNPTAAPTPKYALNAASAFGWSLNAAAAVAGTTGILGTASIFNMRIIPFVNNNFYGRMNSQADKTTPNTDGLGLYTVSRDSSSALNFYKNGALVAALSDAVTFFPNLVFEIHSNGWVGPCAAAGFGVSLTAADNTALYNALRAYLTGVGVP